jgi:hypothetical protein
MSLDLFKKNGCFYRKIRALENKIGNMNLCTSWFPIMHSKVTISLVCYYNQSISLGILFFFLEKKHDELLISTFFFIIVNTWFEVFFQRDNKYIASHYRDSDTRLCLCLYFYIILMRKTRIRVGTVTSFSTFFLSPELVL